MEVVENIVGTSCSMKCRRQTESVVVKLQRITRLMPGWLGEVMCFATVYASI